MENNSEIITDIGQLVSWLAQGEKPQKNWRIGTEHEKFLFHKKDLKPVAYNEVNGIRDVLNKLCSTIGSKAIPIMEGTNIGLRRGLDRVAN